MAFSTAAEGKAYAKGRMDERKMLTTMSSPGPAKAFNPIRQGEGMPPSNTRFRSFAERWVIARADKFRTDHIEEDTWRSIQDARRAYKQVEAVGRMVVDDDIRQF